MATYNKSAAGRKTTGQKAAGRTTVSQKTTGRSTAGQKTAGRSSVSQKTGGRSMGSHTTAGRTSAGQTSTGWKSSERTAVGQKTAGRTTSGQKTASRTTAGEKTAGWKSSGRTTGSQKTVSRTTSGEKTAGWKSSGRTAVSQKTTGRTTGGRPSASGRKKRRGAAASNMLVLRLLILVVAVLVVFEGRLIATMFTQHTNPTAFSSTAAAGASRSESVSEAEVTGAENTDTAAEKKTGSKGYGSGEVGLAGFGASGSAPAENGGEGAASAASSSTSETASDDGRISEELDDPKVVPLQSEKVDDSYFSDAVFIGDSRMEGFRNTSGITQGEFMTSVGMSLSGIGDTKVNTSDGQITVYQGLSGRQYGKIYLMLGTNDLGYYPWEEFKGHAEDVLAQMHELQPGAVIYVCGVIYVEGQKIATEYVNNDNVRKVNGYLLEACDDLDYCWYLNLNEVFTNGYGALIDGATNDGVHMSGKYTALMLDYLKSHYLPETLAAETAGEESTE